MHDGSGEVARSRWARPPGWALAAFTALLGGVWIYAESKLGGDMFLGFAVLLGIAIAGLTWFVRTVLALSHRRAWSPMFLVAPLIGAVTVVTIGLGVPFQARWALARPAFERAAQATLSGELPQHDRRRIGGFEVSPSITDGTVRFMMWGSGGLMDIHYLVYAPDGTTVRAHGEHPDRNTVEHIDGPWWHVMEIF